MEHFEQTIGSFISSEGLLDNSSKLLLAVSGGVDSVALMHCLNNLKERGIIKCRIAVAHVNHCLRGQASDGDQRFVIEAAEKLGIEAITESADVRAYAKANSLSIETAARQLRHRALQKIADKLGCDAVVTGHHKDDNAETILHRMMRGTGFKGLGGIRPIRTIYGTVIISPMLCVGRDTIVEYAKQCGLTWRHDHTNADCEITRNRIRHLLIPALRKDYAGSIANDLAELSAACRKLYEKIDKQIASLGLPFEHDRQHTKPAINIDIEMLTARHRLVQVEIIRRAMESAGCGLKYVKAEHYDAVIGLCPGKSGRRVELPGGFVAMKDYGSILISPSEAVTPERADLGPDNSKLLTLNGSVDFAGYLISTEKLDIAKCDADRFFRTKDSFVEWFDLDRVSGPLTVRRRRDGDKFQPIGAKGSKKIGKFITTEKIPARLRQSLVIIEDSEKIIWLCPLRPSDKTRVTPKTKKILQISVSAK